jgi:hypothetical protein
VAARAAAAKAAAGQKARTNAAFVIPPPTATGVYVTFDVPGAVFGTFPLAINNDGVITGPYSDNSATRGFLREHNGVITTFDVPGAFDTFPTGINNGSAVTGYYINNGFHGFVREHNGAFTTFDVLGAVNGIFPVAINPKGAVTGQYFDVNFVGHGFLREPNGSITTFDAPFAAPNFTTPDSITPDGLILGFYVDPNVSNFFESSFGFARSASGEFTKITGPGGLGGQAGDPFAPSVEFSPEDGAPLSINPAGLITGSYFEPIAGVFEGGIFHVFVQSKDSEDVTFDAANYPPCCIWSFPVGINPAGTITGLFNDGFNINHGFLRTREGILTTFDVPAAGQGNNQGTLPVGITPGGTIAGGYVDAKGVNHGFLFLPSGQ